MSGFPARGCRPRHADPSDLPGMPGRTAMSPRALLVCTETQWIGTARFPHALADAGFEVALLAPQGALVEKSRFCEKVGHLPAQATAAQWVHAFAAMVRAVDPVIVIPGDDMAFRLMNWLYHTPPAGLQPALHAELAALIRRSLGDPDYYLVTVDKTRMPRAAVAAGVTVPPFVVAETVQDARDFLDTHGLPVVAKQAWSSGGNGVAICETAGELHAAFAAFARAPASALASGPARGVLVQKLIVGRRMFYPVVAWQGRTLCGYASEKLVANPEPKGPATVARRHRDDAARAVVERAVAAFGMSGIVDCELMADDATGERFLIEMNRRVTPGLNTSARYGVDLCGALRAAIEDRPYTGGTDYAPGQSQVIVLFPQEWLRDPQSKWLRTHPVDVPWDEPELFEALLAMRHP